MTRTRRPDEVTVQLLNSRVALKSGNAKVNRVTRMNVRGLVTCLVDRLVLVIAFIIVGYVDHTIIQASTKQATRINQPWSIYG